MNPRRQTGFRAELIDENSGGVFSAQREPSLSEILLLLATIFAMHLVAVLRVGGFWERAAPWFDKAEYLEIAATIRQWHLPGGSTPKEFWGFPYAIVAASKLFFVPEHKAIVIVSALASVAVCILVQRLYGGWVAGAFIVINYQWIVLSVEGGSEPLFMCLLFGSFLAARSNRWNIAALLAALSTTVRPVGVFGLIAFAAVLAARKNYRQLTAITLIAVATGVFYVVPLWIIMGSPFANFVGYRRHWGPQGWALTFPFGALVPSYLTALHGMRWTFFVFSAVWPIVALVGIVAMCLPGNRQRLWLYPPESLFAFMYILFLFTYNDREISLAFDRYLEPSLPLLLFAMHDWIPRDRRVLWGAGVISALLSAAVVVSFRNIFGFNLP